jgi:hypothetical protein
MKFAGSIDELRGARGPEVEFAVEVKANAARLAEALGEAGARCEVLTPLSVAVTLPPAETTGLVFRAARGAGVQVRALAERRESVEAAFVRVIGADSEAA